MKSFNLSEVSPLKSELIDIGSTPGDSYLPDILEQCFAANPSLPLRQLLGRPAMRGAVAPQALIAGVLGKESQ